MCLAVSPLCAPDGPATSITSEPCEQSPHFCLQQAPNLTLLTQQNLHSFLLFHGTIAIIGYVLLISTHIPGAQYTGTFLAASGVYPMVPVLVMWNGNNVGGSVKRGVAIAMQVGVGNCGGIIASFM